MQLLGALYILHRPYSFTCNDLLNVFLNRNQRKHNNRMLLPWGLSHFTAKANACLYIISDFDCGLLYQTIARQKRFQELL